MIAGHIISDQFIYMQVKYLTIITVRISYSLLKQLIIFAFRLKKTLIYICKAK